MSYAIDANILLYAVNCDSPHHSASRTFVETCAASAERWLLPWPTVHAFLRIATHPAILPHPLSPAEAISEIEALIKLPQVELVAEDDHFWSQYRNEISDLHLRGNLLSDGLLVAMLKTHGITHFFSHDRDFLRFKGMKVVDPLA